MWVKRTMPEIADERERLRRGRVRSAIFFSALMLVVVMGICGPRGAHYFVSSMREFLIRFPVALLPAGIFGIGTYYFSRKRSVMICPNCEATKYDDGAITCSCGRRFEKIEEMKYVS
jgi:hypothetical protein